FQVDPTRYRDNKTRLFVHFQAGNKHCFNVLCPGFIIVNNVIPINMAFDKISTRGGKTWEFAMFIEQVHFLGNWWIIVDEDYDQIGFWPQKIFTKLTSFANNVEWGGVACSPSGVPKPPMGSSFFPVGNSVSDGYCRALKVLNNKGATINVNKTTIYVDDTNLYQVLDDPQVGIGKFKHCAFFGGPGESSTLNVMIFTFYVKKNMKYIF
ncbi:hypothetical protein MTR67_037253, partial [Solanum verrucosum]